jgi:ABC-type phosphate/phosphonate transport system substrate-binding protein
MIDGNHLVFAEDGTLPPDTSRVIARTGAYDHCNMTVVPELAPTGTVERFASLLLSMSYGDPEVRPLLDLEGLHEWHPGRLEGYRLLEDAVDRFGFYDEEGTVTADGYRP